MIKIQVEVKLDSIVGLICITVIGVVAILKGLDGATTVAGTCAGGIAGYMARDIKNKIEEVKGDDFNG